MKSSLFYFLLIWNATIGGMMALANPLGEQESIPIDGHHVDQPLPMEGKRFWLGRRASWDRGSNDQRKEPLADSESLERTIPINSANEEVPLGGQQPMERELMSGGMYVTDQFDALYILDTDARQVPANPSGAAGPELLYVEVNQYIAWYRRDARRIQNLVPGSTPNVYSTRRCARS